jgi:hypothetical protein
MGETIRRVDLRIEFCERFVDTQKIQRHSTITVSSIFLSRLDCHQISSPFSACKGRLICTYDGLRGFFDKVLHSIGTSLVFRQVTFTSSRRILRRARVNQTSFALFCICRHLLSRTSGCIFSQHLASFSFPSHTVS